ncbi:hypothetical protein [Paenibacillus harenae]|uniref:Uncharacterized protein n=1 Tax=Paenibacillus harenae TaxID=306543 RepID=A0ABT9U018_PAEHA|nr:hypothetical protein [Paenibacillus harenae]MDQ0112313.1 hypothetical protein [Paenibacillus harenae]
MKGMTGNGGGTASIKRSFPAAPGEKIERGDVVTVFNNELYRNAEQPVSKLPRFSPDVLYMQQDEDCRAVHPIGGDGFIYIGTTNKQINIYRVDAGADGIAVKARKSIPIYGVEGINYFLFKALTDEMGIICYLEHNTEEWALRIIRWGGTEELLLGERFESQLYANGEPIIESVSESSFLLVWHCTKAVPQRLKASVCTIGAGDAIAYHGYAMELETNETLHYAFAFNKLSENVFAASYWLISNAQGSLVTRMLLLNGEGALVLGEKSIISTTTANRVELRQLILSPSKFVLIFKLGGDLSFYTIVIKDGNVPIADAPYRFRFYNEFYDAVKVSEDRFMCVDNNIITATLMLSVFDTVDGKTSMLTGKTLLNSVKGSYNKLRLVPLGQSLFALTFNHEPERDYAYTQAIMVKITPIQNVIEDLNLREQLINVWDQGAAVDSFDLSALGESGRFVAAGRGRLKLFRCAWSPVRFISSGVGEFGVSTGDHDVNGRTLASIVLSDGSVAVAYRERDTWHGKLSVFRMDIESGDYRPVLSHTFSYSHVDNISMAEVVPGKIALQYKQRLIPAYDSKQMNRGDGSDEVKVMIAAVSAAGLSGKTTTSFNLPEHYINSTFVKLDNGYLLHAGVTDRLAVMARVVKFESTGESVTFTAMQQSVTIDYERLHASVVRLGPNKVAIRSDIRTMIAEVDNNGALLVSQVYYIELLNRVTRGVVGDGQGGLIQLTTHSTGNEALLELTPYGSSGLALYQTDDTMARKQSAMGILTDMSRMDGKAAFVYKSRWASGRMASKSEPHQLLRLALLSTEDFPHDDRFYPFPGTEDTQPVFLPLGGQRAFCIGTDPAGNQIYMLAYSDGDKLSFGKPNLKPHGIAVSGGEAGALVEVAMRGIAEYDEQLKAGSVYYSNRDGRLSMDAAGIKVGLAISEHELLIE